ncbi:C-type lectin domain family 14 member A [Syngnathus typhle]|uniref:C-type lectin domain family 14 member A n=1 Tax=Syngnathus typhle TaxID=161592 RepID=UPI002A69A6A1|nr:C-type lectin domain family 14 member A [Syngnathus typhle]
MLLPPRSVFLQLLVFTLSLMSLSAAPKFRPRYSVRHSPLPFERAQEACHPHGLASFTRPQELAQVLGAIAESLTARSPALWVGLKKAKNQCVVPSLPLRGFAWTHGGEDATETHWAHEPEQTCTSVLCAGLVAQLNGSAVNSWGLVPLSCKTKNHFICNLELDDRGLAGPELASPEPATLQPPGAETAEPESARPHLPGAKVTGPEFARPELSEQKPEIPVRPTLVPVGPERVGPESATPEPSQQEPQQPKPEPARPELVGPESTRPAPAEHELKEQDRRPDEPGLDTGPESESGPCPRPVVTGARFLSLDPDNSSRIQVDCWSKVRLGLHCWGRAGVWRLPGGAPANLSTVCTPCGTGYHKDTMGDCVDVDECSGVHGCRHECMNTAGSFSCVCPKNETACEPSESDAPRPFSGALVLALVGAAVVLLVLVLVALLTIWCCLRRQRQKKQETEQRDKLAT